MIKLPPNFVLSDGVRKIYKVIIRHIQRLKCVKSLHGVRNPNQLILLNVQMNCDEERMKSITSTQAIEVEKLIRKNSDFITAQIQYFKIDWT